MSQHINCGVSNCHYWSSGNKCQADEISVVSDQFGSSQSNSMDATSSTSLPSASVQSCVDTCCKTFSQKGSGQSNVDSGKKQKNSTQSTFSHNPTH